MVDFTAMKKLPIASTIYPGMVINAGDMGTALNNEVICICITFITLVLVMISTDQILKYVFKNFRKHEEGMGDHQSVEHAGE